MNNNSARSSISGFLKHSFYNNKLAYGSSYILSVVQTAVNLAAPYCLTQSVIELKKEGTDDFSYYNSLSWLAGYAGCCLLIKLLPLVGNEILQPVCSNLAQDLTKNVVKASYDLPILQRLTYSTPPSVHHFGIAYEHIGQSFVIGIHQKILPSLINFTAACIIIPVKFGSIGMLFGASVVANLGLVRLFVKKVAYSQNEYIYGLMKTYAFIISRLDEYANVHYFGALERQLAELNRGIDRLDNFLNHSVLIRNRIQFLQSSLVTGLTLLGTALFYQKNPFNENITHDQFLWIMLYLFQISPCFYNLAEGSNKLIADYESFKQLTGYLNEAESKRGINRPLLNITPATASIEFQNIKFQYIDNQLILNNISFHIPAQQTILVTGSSGAGKSSLFNLLLGFFELNSGRIMIAGQDITHVDLDSLRASISIVPQFPGLQNKTIYENIQYANITASQEEIESAAQKAGLSELIADKGEEFKIGENGSKLSGGQRQRIAIARAYLRDTASILLMDEPTSALDPITEKEIIKELANLLQETPRTTFIITHRLNIVNDLKIDRILYFDGGHIAEEGSLEQLMQKNGLFAIQMAITQKKTKFQTGITQPDGHSILHESSFWTKHGSKSLASIPRFGSGLFKKLKQESKQEYIKSHSARYSRYEIKTLNIEPKKYSRTSVFTSKKIKELSGSTSIQMDRPEH